MAALLEETDLDKSIDNQGNDLIHTQGMKIHLLKVSGVEQGNCSILISELITLRR